MKRAIVRMLAICLLLAAGCNPQLKQGTVVSKHYVPENTWLMPMMIGNSTMLMPHTDPERWVLVIGGHLEDGRYVTQESSVDEGLYNQFSIGDEVVFPD